MSENNDLQTAIEMGIINIQDVQRIIEMKKREEILAKHPYKIWQGKDGKWFTYLPDGENGRILKKRTSESAIQEIVIEHWKKREENPTIKEVFVEWAEKKLEDEDISAPTFERYYDDYNRYFSEFGKRKIKTVTEDDLEEFIKQSIRKFRLTTKGYTNLKILINGIFKLAKKKRYVNFGITDFWDGIEISKKKFKINIKPDSEEVFNDEEYEKVELFILDNVDCINLGLLLLFCTGLRVGEISALKWTDYDGISVKILRTETRYKDENGKYLYTIKDFPKTPAGVREVVIPPQSRWILEKVRNMNPNGEFIFEKNGRRVKTYSFRKRLYTICNILGISKKSPHKIRKTYASILLDNQVAEKIVTDLMGHADINCTNRFYAKNRKTVEAKANILSNIAEFDMKTAN